MAAPTAREIVAAMEAMESAIAAAYLEQIRLIVDSVTIAQVEQLLQYGDTESVGDLLAAAAFVGFLEALRSTFLAGGRFEVKYIVIPARALPYQGAPRPPKIRPEFDIRAAEAEAALKRHNELLMAKLKEDQRQAVRATVAAGIQLQQSPRQTALDIVGRISPQTGRRSGGVVGLAEPQAAAAIRAREQLLSGNAAQLKQYLTRTRRDHRFDGIVNRALEAGKPVAKADVDRIVGRYADRLLRSRGDALAKTSTLSLFGASRDQVYQQLVGGVVKAENVSKTWKDRGDGKVRHTHEVMGGQRVLLNQPFHSPSGAQLLYPGDQSLGAPDGEVVGCRCSAIYKVRFT